MERTAFGTGVTIDPRSNLNINTWRKFFAGVKLLISKSSDVAQCVTKVRCGT